MKNKIIKIFLLFTIILAIFNTHPVYADTLKDQILRDQEALLDAKDPSQNASYWEPTIDNNSTKFESTIETMLGYINVIGIIVSVIIVGIVGIKYMLGSVEEKAEYKKTILGYVIGALLLFSATTIPNILYKIGTSI